MKLLFTADWHIKLGQKNVPKEWQIDRYRSLFNKIYEVQNEVELIIVGGDIFDKLPTLEELDLYYDFLYGITTKTIIYDGNHEATKKNKTFFHNLVNVSNKINDKISVLQGIYEYKGIDFIPYTNIKSFKENDFKNKILCTHVRGNIPPHVKSEIDLDRLNKWEVVLAGDLHAYSNSQRNIIYPGSPLSTTFHRSKIKNGIIIFDTDNMSHEWVDLKLPQLIRKTVTDKKDIVKTYPDHTIYEIEGDIKNLANIDTNDELIDKKIINKNSEAILSFKNKSIAEEVIEYLRNVMKLDDKTIQVLMEVYYDNIKIIELE